MNRLFLPSLFAIFHLFTANGIAATVPLGGKSAVMGGASAAQGHDSAAPYTNPAGIALIPHNTIAASANLYSYTASKVNNFFMPNGGTGPFSNLVSSRDSLESSDVKGFPGAVVGFYHLNSDDSFLDNQTLAFSILLIDQQSTVQNGKLEATQPGLDAKESLTQITENSTYHIGLSYALAYKRLRVGLTVPLIYHRSFVSSQISNTYSLTSGTMGFFDTEAYTFHKRSSLGVSLILGTQVNLSKSFSFGAAVQLPTHHLTDDYTYKTHLKSQGLAIESNLIMKEEGVGDYSYSEPPRVRVGFSYDNSRNFSISFDSNLNLKQDSTFEGSLPFEKETLRQNSSPEQKKMLWSFGSGNKFNISYHVGTSYRLTNKFELIGGFSYEPKKFDLNRDTHAFLDQSLEYFGYSLGLGMSGATGRTNFGLVYRVGKGEILAKDFETPSELHPMAIKEHQIALVLSGSIDFANFSKDIKKIIKEM